jgi:hypothetical protein
MSHEGFSEHGIDTFTPYVGRGVLLDVARLHGVDVLPAGYGVTAEDLAGAAQAAGVEVREGDAVLIGTGWSRRWNDGPAFIGHDDGVPGPDVSAAQWLADRGVRVAGGETIAFEQIKPAGHALLPVHRMPGGGHQHRRAARRAARRGGGRVPPVLALRVVGATGPSASAGRSRGVG